MFQKIYIPGETNTKDEEKKESDPVTFYFFLSFFFFLLSFSFLSPKKGEEGDKK